MTEQLALPVPDGTERYRKLSVDQERALAFVRGRDGVTARELGAHLHANRTDGKQHPEDRPCDWCETRGRSIASSKGLKPLVTYRNTGHGRVYVPRDAADRAAASKPSSGLIATSDPNPATNVFADL